LDNIWVVYAGIEDQFSFLSLSFLMQIFDFTISADDMAVIAKVGAEKHKRLVNPPFRPNGGLVFSD